MALGERFTLWSHFSQITTAETSADVLVPASPARPPSPKHGMRQTLILEHIHYGKISAYKLIAFADSVERAQDQIIPAPVRLS
jgi:hypothetical protein